jgi:site-specific DNA recombinase
LYGRNMNGSNRIRLLRARAKDNSVQTEAIATTAVGYIRVSTEEQATNGHGLEVQNRAIRSFAESQGYALVDVISDPGVSGAKLWPDLFKPMRAVSAEQIAIRS